MSGSGSDKRVVNGDQKSEVSTEKRYNLGIGKCISHSVDDDDRACETSIL